jgi:hypothetical protein
MSDSCGISFDEPLEAELLASMKEQASWESLCGWAR